MTHAPPSRGRVVAGPSGPRCRMPVVSEVIERARTDAETDAFGLVKAWVGRPGSLGALVDGVGGVDQVGVTERADALKKRSIKRESKVWALELAIAMMDLTTLEGKDTEGKVRALCAKGRRPDPIRPVDPERRGHLHLSDVDHGRARGARGQRRPRRQRRDGLPVGPDVRRAQGHGDAPGGRGRRRRDRHGHRPRRVPLRGLRDGVRRDRRGQGSVRRGAPQGHPRDRRARDVRQRPAREHPRDGGRSRLHQDLDRQGDACRDAAGHARHARGHPRFPSPHRTCRRDEAGRRHPDGEGGDRLPRRPLRDARPARG